MFLSSSFFLVLASALVARADVFPNFPAADVLRSGSNCHIAWGGDTSSTTAWKDMTIQLMTGDNFNMVHITTVTTGRDGSVDGSFDWICPEVTPNSAIYFYQFRSPHTPNYAWTTRFTIASSTGQTTPPLENVQPDGAQIPWGTGALKDPSTAVPPPVFPTPTTTTTTTSAPGPTSTPTNVAPGVIAGCTSFFTETNLLCYEIAAKFGITVENFQAWNGGANVCNVLQTGLAYCVAARPTNVAPGVIAGCTSYFTETDLLCYQIAAQYGITVTQFESWNGGSNACNVLQSGLAYCIAGPTITTPTPTPVATPTNVASGVVSGCTTFFTETNLLCYEIAANYGITVTQFEGWNGAGVCNVLQTGKAYCVAGP
ncbi:hypothetical protein FPV67DRAFT_1491391 [Lyophyllum atratum]|nr:hypothetical protein FPV67DRAFT_1491391 [Lyophyllum atratum]